MCLDEQARALVTAVLPDLDIVDARIVRGEFHDVVLVPGAAAVKIARGDGVPHLERRAGLLRALAAMDLPFAVPEPLSPVIRLGDCSTVALSWVHGETPPAGTGDPTVIRQLLLALAHVDVSAVADWLGEPHAYAGGSRWASLMRDVAARMPGVVRSHATARVEAAISLPAVVPSLVHGDLAGSNIRCHPDGSISGIVDWDLAQPLDPAIDVACLAWFGWPAVRAAVDDETFQRARTWQATFRMESVAAAIDACAHDEVIDGRLRDAAHDLAAG